MTEAQALLEFTYAALVLVVAYAVRGTTGFGGQAMAVPLMALILPLQVVVPVITVLTALSSFTYWKRDRDKIAWGEIFRLLPFTLLGVMLGLYVFERADPAVLTKAFGLFIVLYALFSMRSSAQAAGSPPRHARLIGSVLSTTSGVLGAIFGAAAGPMYVIYFNLLNYEKQAFRATVTTILMFQAFARIAGYVKLGLFDRNALLLIAMGLPLMLIGAWIGAFLSNRVNQQVFNRCVAAMLLVSGIALIVK